MIPFWILDFGFWILHSYSVAILRPTERECAATTVVRPTGMVETCMGAFLAVNPATGVRTGSGSDWVSRWV